MADRLYDTGSPAPWRNLKCPAPMPASIQAFFIVNFLVKRYEVRILLTDIRHYPAFELPA